MDIFLPCDNWAATEPTIIQAENCPQVRSISLLVGQEETIDQEQTATQRLPQIAVDSLHSTKTLMQIAGQLRADYALIITKATPITLGEGAIERLLHAAADSHAALIYADHYEKKAENGTWSVERHPAIDYQTGHAGQRREAV